MILTTANSHWQELQAAVQGAVITPADPGYDEARLAWNRRVNQHPAVIIVVKNAEDVATAVQAANHHNLKVAIQATGHGNIRPADDCMLILTSAMDGVTIDAQAQTAWVEAGVKWGAVLEKAQAVGLAPLLGSAPHVGVVGYTLGGGMGWLARKYGLSADSVNRFEIVTAVGKRIQVSATENPDLFWGLRGGGGCLGIVTGMEIRLYPITTVYAGNLFYPAAMAKEVFTHYRNWIPELPDELTSSVSLMNFPPLPILPEFLRGQSFVMVRGCFCGPISEGEALLSYWRDWQSPLIDDFKTIPFTQAASISNDPVDPLPGLSTGAWLKGLSDTAIDTLIRYTFVENGPPPLVFAEIRHAGGAMAQSQNNVYGNRDAQHILQMMSMVPNAAAHDRARQYTDQIKQALAPDLTGGVYMNFLEDVESQQRVRNGLKENGYEELAALKAKVDPENRLGYGFNILPAS